MWRYLCIFLYHFQALKHTFYTNNHFRISLVSSNIFCAFVFFSLEIFSSHRREDIAKTQPNYSLAFSSVWCYTSSSKWVPLVSLMCVARWNECERCRASMYVCERALDVSVSFIGTALLCLCWKLLSLCSSWKAASVSYTHTKMGNSAGNMKKHTYTVHTKVKTMRTTKTTEDNTTTCTIRRQTKTKRSQLFMDFTYRAAINLILFNTHFFRALSLF